MKTIIPFGKWTPDAPYLQPPGELTANNVIPWSRGYIPVSSLNAASNALSARCLGAGYGTASTGVNYLYAGDSTKLYEAPSSTAPSFVDQSKGGGYSTATGEVWEFAFYDRNSKVVATNYTDAVQSMTIGLGASSAFADMITGTNKPKARHVAIVNQFVVLGNTNDATDGARLSRIWWSGFGDETSFDPSSATQSDYEDLSTGGPVQKIISGSEYGLIFQRECVRAMRYIGGLTIFEFPVVNYVPGTPYPNSVVAYAGRIFYIADDGFMMLNGLDPVHIGSALVDQQFINTISTQSVANYWCFTAGIDPIKKCVYWAVASSGTTPGTIFTYNWERDKWSLITQTMETFSRVDNFVTVGHLGAFDSTHKLAVFSGTVLVATIETGDLMLSPGKWSQVNGIRILMDAGGAKAPPDINFHVIGKQSEYSASATYTQSAAMNSEGYATFRSGGRYHSVRCSISSSFASILFQPPHFMGIEIDYEEEGER